MKRLNQIPFWLITICIIISATGVTSEAGNIGSTNIPQLRLQSEPAFSEDTTKSAANSWSKGFKPVHQSIPLYFIPNNGQVHPS